jgi:hypothetical protein
MQHLDEGVIHSWLDGALSPEEAAHADAHVKECAQCAAAVAEARGFIAASSRILTALDNAPRGVIPATAPRRRVDPMVWRIAATLLVVAGGTLVVVRSQSGTSRAEAIAADSSASQATAASGPVISPAAPNVSAANENAASAGPPPAADFSGKRLAETPAPKPRRQLATENSRSDLSRSRAALRDAISPQLNQKVTAQEAAPTGAPAPSSVAQSQVAQSQVPQSQVAGAMALDQSTATEPLKVVGQPRRIGAKVTLYEVAPGDTVTLTESAALALESVVVTGIGTTRMAPQAAGTAAASAPKRGEARPTTAVDSQVVVSALSGAVAGSAASSAQPVRAMNSISWVDRTTGATLTLSGRMPGARLEQIRVRIERERAAAAARKNP